QPRQFLAHAGDARADQGLVTDELEGEADQDRREGGEPWPLCYLPNGQVAIPRQMFQEILRLIAQLRPQPPPALAEDARCHAFKQPAEGVRPNARENGQINPRPSVRVTRGAGSGQHLGSVLQERRENASIDAGLGFIWRISVKANMHMMMKSFFVATALIA